ncbi:M48 family metallopeptidase [Helicobacter pametensis]|uniref:M48 family metallopeptidase n=1 Tax=Helicobacter pametensis TaxID=95149 RepID=UPI000A046C53|nr:SprT family zinc-dependent metalloprotease [Helicobacter pametensis]
MQHAKVIYKDIKNMILKVKPSLEVVLSVPRGTSQKEIDYILHKRQAWIQKALQRFQSTQIPPRELTSGEDIYDLGRRYRLKVIISSSEGVRIEGEFLELRVREGSDFRHREKVLKAWQKQRARECFGEILNHFIALLDFEPIKILRIKEMKTRWGSCNPKKSYINLNLRLIEKDKRAIEYVILHELAHLKHYHHDKAFYDFVALYMPDWRERKMKLLERL